MNADTATPSEASKGGAAPDTPDAAAPMAGDSPEARMSRRFPQKIVVGHLIGAEVVADDRKVLGIVRQVVRTPAAKIKLIVAYSRWFGLFPKLVAVPIEKVGSLGPQVGSIDMDEAEYIAAPAWQPGTDQPLPDSEIIRIALAKR